MKRVLILGAGLVVRPMVEYLLEREITVKIATTTREKADNMIRGNPYGTSLKWSADDTGTLGKLVSGADVVVSFLPWRHHVTVAGVCIENRKPLVTTSYVQPEMMALDRQAREAGVLLLNEIGLDPGIDHMTAMKVIDHIHGKKGTVTEFWSMCGALPAPEAADNPMKYKFSWSPRGVVMAGKNSALYMRKGKEVTIDPDELFRDTFIYNFPGIGDLEVYPNRDSVSYLGIYGITGASTMYRGTFRYKGWCETLDAMKRLGMLDDEITDFSNMTYAGFMAERAGTGIAGLRKEVASKLGLSEDSIPLQSLEYLGFFTDEILNYTRTSPFEITSDRMIQKMVLNEKERDMVVMQHIFLASYPDGEKEVIKSSMLDFGTPSENTAVARTVALPAACAVRMILEKELILKGVHRPVLPEIYEPVLEELKTLGIEMKEEYGLSESQMNLHETIG
ncbi:MAG: saccharopine dehydrogenase C-terminal domain-containing protein [Bacteroidales bacterium]|jgi:saccharopine dehydrogenase-like NADP-dependent oxidoreductase|nr:saccharopine dehydrogenase C-terminal domain-containing protein [Bacteroidales bacterium]